MVLIPAGSYEPFLKETRRVPSGARVPRTTVDVAAFWLDRLPVTNGEFLAFVDRHPAWRRSNVKPIFADGRYLASWRSDRELARPNDTDRPVTEISWFAAAAYCEAAGADLPTIDQWEFALEDQARDREGVRDRSLAWYGRPGTAAVPVDLAAVNGYGVAGMVGSIWEWTLDFNSVPSSEEARDPGARNSTLFCGGGSIGALDPTDFAAYMRFAVRASLKAAYTQGTLGFRCAVGAGA
jgi:formylglycine-generating enzyme required for sulfatase activity